MTQLAPYLTPTSGLIVPEPGAACPALTGVPPVVCSIQGALFPEACRAALANQLMENKKAQPGPGAGLRAEE